MDKTSMWDLNKVLIVFLPDIDILLPIVILPNHECSDSFPGETLNDPMALCMEVMINLACPFVGKSLDTSRRMAIALEFALQVCLFLIVVLVHCLEWTPV